MAIDVERKPLALSIQDDPMRIAPRNGSRPIAQIADPAPLGLAALGLTLMVFSMFNAGLLATHVVAAGAARTRSRDRMIRRRPAHQPIAGWRGREWAATLVAMDRSLDPPRRSLPTGASGVVAAPDHPLCRC